MNAHFDLACCFFFQNAKKAHKEMCSKPFVQIKKKIIIMIHTISITNYPLVALCLNILHTLYQHVAFSQDCGQTFRNSTFKTTNMNIFYYSCATTNEDHVMKCSKAPGCIGDEGVGIRVITLQTTQTSHICVFCFDLLATRYCIM